MLARVTVARRLEEIEPVSEPSQQLLRREEGRSRRGELERERQLVEPIAEVGDDVARHEARIELTRARDEQLDSIATLHRGHGVHVLSLQLQPLSARHDDDGPLDRTQVGDRPGDRGKQVLSVVEQKQGLLSSQANRQPVATVDIRFDAKLKRLADRERHERRVLKRRQRSPPDSIRVLVRNLRACVQRESRLPCSTRPGQSDETHPVTLQQRHELRQLAIAPEERRRRHRQVRPVQALERWELLIAELVQLLGRGEVLQAVPAELLELLRVVEKITSRLRKDDLAPVRRGHDPRCAMNVDADVLRAVQDGLSRVDPNPDQHPAGLDHLRGGASSGYGLARARKGVEEGITLVVDLVPVETAERIAHGRSMLREQLAVPVGAGVEEQPRRALDVGEHEGHRSGRLVCHSSDGAPYPSAGTADV